MLAEFQLRESLGRDVLCESALRFGDIAEVEEHDAAEEMQDSVLVDVVGAVESKRRFTVFFGSCQDLERFLQVDDAHFAEAGPEIHHLEQRADSHGVDERAAARLGAGVPFGDFAAGEDVEGELAAHEALFGGVGEDFVEVFVCCRRVFGGLGRVGEFGRAVEFDVAGPGDVVVERVAPVVEADAGDEGGGAVGVAVHVH